MFQGLLALLGRSLRVDARSWQVHLARVGLMVAIYVSLSVAVFTGARFGAPGLQFFRSIVWLNVAFLTLLGIGFFSTAITEEKEEDTLGLMQMAGISPVRILLGKIGGRLFQALLLILVQYPFTLLAVTMGGVTSTQIRCAFVGLGAFMLLLAGFGLFCSTVAPRSRTSSGLIILGLVLYVAIPYAAYEFHQFLIDNEIVESASMWGGLLEWIGNSCLYLQINTIMTSTFNESPFSAQAISNIVGGLVCFFAAWALFPLCTRNPSTESVSRGMLSHKKASWRILSPGRPGTNPHYWKDFYFTGGGLGMILVRVAFYVALWCVSYVLCEFWWGSNSFQGQYPNQRAIFMYQLLVLFIITIELALVLTRCLNDEVRNQTLATLVMLPESLNSIVYSKLLGGVSACLPGLVCLFTVSSLTTAGWHHTGEFFDEAAGYFFLAHFLLVPHLAMVLGLYLRWGCVPLAVGLGIGSLFGWVSIFESMRIGPGDGIVWFATITLSVICVGCHFWIASQLPAVAARN
jgi:ABC-type transport system involved in multi-copper enzyme maturation permease subunit